MNNSIHQNNSQKLKARTVAVSETTARFDIDLGHLHGLFPFLKLYQSWQKHNP